MAVRRTALNALLLERGKRLRHEGGQDIRKRGGGGVESREGRMGPVVMNAREALHRIASPPLGLAGKGTLKHRLHPVARGALRTTGKAEGPHRRGRDIRIRVGSTNEQGRQHTLPHALVALAAAGQSVER